MSLRAKKKHRRRTPPPASTHRSHPSPPPTRGLARAARPRRADRQPETTAWRRPKRQGAGFVISLRFVDWQSKNPVLLGHAAACMGNAAVAGAAAAGAATAWGLGLIPRTSGRLFLRAMRPCSAVRARTQAWRDSRCSCGLGRAAPAGCWGVPRRLRPVRVVCLIRSPPVHCPGRPHACNGCRGR